MKNKTESRPYEYYSMIAAKDVDWLWYPYIPCGKITILQGDPGEGKSTVMIRLTAAVTTGGLFPDGTKNDVPSTVIYQCAEDGLQDTIKPRLLQAGADCEKVAFIMDDDQSLSLSDDRIERSLQETKAKLLVLDPLQAFIKQDGDILSATRMRSIMRKLSSLAERYRCAIVLIGHLNKANGSKSLYRGLGSIDITAIARSVLMISRDEKTPEIRYMYSIKSSLAPESCAIGFVLDPKSGFHWIGKCQYQKADYPTRERASLSKKERALEILRLMLSVEDVKSIDALSRLTWLGISERTIRSAQKELGVEAYRRNNAWYLHLETNEYEESAPDEDQDNVSAAGGL